MGQEELKNATEFAEYILLWVGFGTVVGLLAKLIMPGRDPGGSVATLLMGIVGTLVGCGLARFLRPEYAVRPISLAGLVVGVAGTFVILLIYRVMSGYYFVEGDYESVRARRRRRSRNRYAYYD